VRPDRIAGISGRVPRKAQDLCQGQKGPGDQEQMVLVSAEEMDQVMVEAVTKESRHVPVRVFEGKDSRLLHIRVDFYFKVVERGDEVWGYLCDESGYRYHYSLPIWNSRYGDGYLNADHRGDWYACAGGMGYNTLVVCEAEMLKVLTELGYYDG
jgi:hypothetical protein